VGEIRFVTENTYSKLRKADLTLNKNNIIRLNNLLSDKPEHENADTILSS